ncbi:MAG TPA: globin family protein [Afipia sp.]
MTPTEVADVQQSFMKVTPVADQVGMMFYGRLFDLDPSLRPMFAEDLTEQSRKLLHVLAVAANGLTHPDTLVPVVQALGAKHVDYGVKDQHYDTVGQALIWTLETGLADAFTPQVKSAWLSAYTLLSGIMKDAAAKRVAAQA